MGHSPEASPEPGSTKYWVKDQVAHLQLNRPERLNAIDPNMLREIRDAVERANFDNEVKVILLYGSGRAFCSGYDLKLYAESPRGTTPGSQKMPWDPFQDYAFIGKANECIMTLWNSLKPVIAKIHGVAIGGGSDIALCTDIIFMAEEARIGYPPARVWGCPTTAMWVYRVGIERAKRILFTGQLLSGKEAASIGLVGEAVPEHCLDEAVDHFIERIITVPSNQLFFQKQVVNNAVEMQGLAASQRLSTVFDGMSRHTPEGVAFQQRAEEAGFKVAIMERDAALLPELLKAIEKQEK